MRLDPDGLHLSTHSDSRLIGRPDAIVIGSGPNGLSAAITLAQAGCSVVVLEAEPVAGGGARSAELTLPGFVHDVCSAVYPLAAASPFFRSLPLARYGLEWIQPSAPLAHPLDDGPAVLLERSIAETANALGPDAAPYCDLLGPIVANWNLLSRDLLSPMRIVPSSPVALMRFGLHALRPASRLARSWFKGERARALFAGLAAHANVPLDLWGTSAFGLVLAAAGHVAGWPIARGGAGEITAALASHLATLGGSIITDFPVRSLDDLPPARAILCDLTPRQLLAIAPNRFPRSYRRQLAHYRYGPGVFKVDYALSGAIPWKAPECRRAATVHIGGTLAEIESSEREPWRGRVSERPYVLFSQPTLFDSSRSPDGKHIAWAYCHIPNGSSEDMLHRIETQIERFAPGFRDLVLARSIMGPAALEAHNANLIGGDVAGGAVVLSHLFTRPTARLYATPSPGLYLCSSSTPPGAGVHGLSGFFAAQLALRKVFGKRVELP